MQFYLLTVLPLKQTVDVCPEVFVIMMVLAVVTPVITRINVQMAFNAVLPKRSNGLHLLWHGLHHRSVDRGGM